MDGTAETDKVEDPLLQRQGKRETAVLRHSPTSASVGIDQTCSLVSRSHQRWGRIKVPNAATAQIVANRRKLAMRKNPPFISCSENGPIMPPPTSLFYHFNQFANRIRNAMILRAIFFSGAKSTGDRVASIHVMWCRRERGRHGLAVGPYLSSTWPLPGVGSVHSFITLPPLMPHHQ